MKNLPITRQELIKMERNQEDFQLIDVREPREHDIYSIGGELIPIGEIIKNIDKIARNKKVVFYCRSGARSTAVIQELEKKLGFNNLYNLDGGVG